jgi:hypothetical protein
MLLGHRGWLSEDLISTDLRPRARAIRQWERQRSKRISGTGYSRARPRPRRRALLLSGTRLRAHPAMSRLRSRIARSKSTAPRHAQRNAAKTKCTQSGTPIRVRLPIGNAACRRTVTSSPHRPTAAGRRESRRWRAALTSPFAVTSALPTTPFLACDSARRDLP